MNDSLAKSVYDMLDKLTVKLQEFEKNKITPVSLGFWMKDKPFGVCRYSNKKRLCVKISGDCVRPVGDCSIERRVEFYENFAQFIKEHDSYVASKFSELNNRLMAVNLDNL